MSRQPARTVILVTSAACVFLTSFALSSYSVFLPALLKDFSWTRADAVLPYTIAMAVWGLTQPFAGSIVDARGSRPVILAGLAILTLGFAIMAVSQTLWQLSLGFGLVIGIAMSACGSLVFSLLIAKSFDRPARASAAGFVHGAVSACPIVMGPLLFFAIASVGWRASALGYAALLLAVAFPLAYLGARDPKSQPGESGQENAGRVRDVLPLLRLQPLRNVFLARMACGLGYGALIPNLGTAALALGLDPADGAFALSVYGSFGVVCTFLSGLAADRWGRPPAVVAALATRGLGILLLAMPALDRPLFFLAVALAAGPISATFSINNVQVFELAGAKRAGLVLGLSVVLHQLAGALGPYFTGLVFDWTGTYRWSFLTLGLLMLLATLPAARTGAKGETATAATNLG